jgi:dGTPase
MIETGEIDYNDIDDETLRARVTADIVASMTEQQAMEVYERITGQSPGLVTDRIV